MTSRFPVLTFLLSLGTHITATSSLVKLALGNHGLKTVCLVVGLQAVAAMISSLILTRHRFSNSSVHSALIAIAILDALLAFLPVAGVSWFAVFFLRGLAAALNISLLMASLRLLAPEGFVLLTRQTQTWNSAAWVIALSVSPILASLVSLNYLYLIDAFMVLLCLFVLRSLLPANSQVIVGGAGEAPGAAALNPEIKFGLAVALLTFVCIGIFNTIELPLLDQRFHISPLALSSVFLIPALLNLSVVKFMNPHVLAMRTREIMIAGSLVLFVATFGLLYSFAMPQIYLSVGLTGVGSGLFLLGLSTLIQKVEEARARAVSYSLLRVVTQLGLLAASVLVALLYGNAADLQNVSGALILVLLCTLPMVAALVQCARPVKDV